MKVVVTAVAPDIEAEIDPRFGRAAYFVAVDTDTMEWTAQGNEGVNVAGGAGTMGAQAMANLGAQAVISGNYGPNAYAALAAGNIAMYLRGSSRTVREAVQAFKDGQLEAVMGGPTGPARHGGRGRMR